MQRMNDIFQELCTLNQFIQIADTKILNVLNGSEVVHRLDGEYIFLQWELVEIEGKDIKSKQRSRRFDLVNAEKYLKAMIGQSRTIDC